MLRQPFLQALFFPKSVTEPPSHLLFTRVSFNSRPFEVGVQQRIGSSPGRRPAPLTLSLWSMNVSQTRIVQAISKPCFGMVEAGEEKLVRLPA